MPCSLSGVLAGDITEVNDDEIPYHDLLTAGFCCQPFSRAGSEEGMDDPRGMLFFEIVRVLKHCRPPMILLENVANLLQHDGGNTMQLILQELRHEGCAAYRQLAASPSEASFVALVSCSPPVSEGF